MSLTTRIFIVLMFIEIMIGLVLLSEPKEYCPVCCHQLQKEDPFCYSCGYQLDSIYVHNYWLQFKKTRL